MLEAIFLVLGIVLAGCAVDALYRFLKFISYDRYCRRHYGKSAF